MSQKASQSSDTARQTAELWQNTPNVKLGKVADLLHDEEQDRATARSHQHHNVENPHEISTTRRQHEHPM